MDKAPDKTLEFLGDIRTYVRIAAAKALRTDAARVIDTYEKSVLFSKLDGNTTQPKLQEITKTSQPTISRWISDFVEAGIVAAPGESYRNHKALFTLRELGIDSASLKKRVQPTESLVAAEAQ